MIKKIENRFLELLRKPKNNEEIKEMEELRKKLDLALREECKDLIIELNKYYEINDVWDLVNTSKEYKKAIPILVRYLGEKYHVKTKEGIARALAVKEAKGIACEAILNEYHNTPKNQENYRWVLGNTMSIIATKDFADKIIEIIKNPENGRSRQMFINSLKNINVYLPKDILKELLKENDEVILNEVKKLEK